MTPQSISLSIVIATYNREELLVKSLTALLTLSDHFDELILVDQTPEHCPETADFLAENVGRKLKVIKLHEPAVCLARNIGIAAVRSDIVLFLDDDIEVCDPRFIEAHKRCYKDDNTHAVQGRILLRDGTPQVTGRRSQEVQLFNSFVTANVSARRCALVRCGGFDESFTGRTYANEDGDLGRRLKYRGYRTIFSYDAVIVHAKAPSGGNRLTRMDRSPEWTKSVTFYQFALRHYEGFAAFLEIARVIRVIALRRENASRFWLLPSAILHSFWAFCIALKRHRQGFRSSLTSSNSE
jgi:GT2 family glycosyltransferase